ncbi:hypothetical protein [Kibdelosporangium philippinense]|uniref:hypothetical protein n=1 Tax=Kibdelosporangium philippinense TaxID=211113 RepID=UPI00361363E0
MSTVPAHRVHHSDTPCPPFRHHEIPARRWPGISRCRNVYFDVSEWWTRSHAAVDTAFRNGGHGVG